MGRSGSHLLAEQWDGSGWRIQPAPVPSGAQFSFLNAVACTSASFCVAVGFPFDSAGNPVATLEERWNGKSWAIQSTPNPAPGSGFG